MRKRATVTSSPGAGSKTLDADKKKTKAQSAAALKESFAICDAAFAALTDSRARETVTMGQSGFQLSKLSLLVSTISHSNEQHGYMAMYLRLKGIVAALHRGDEHGTLRAENPTAARTAGRSPNRSSLRVTRAKVGGERGIRTLGRVSPTHAFQACSFNHSDISPF